MLMAVHKRGDYKMVTNKKISMCLFVVSLSCVAAHAGTFTIPDWLTSSTVFVMKGEQAKGTGLLMAVTDYNATFCYLVTAKHVVKPLLSEQSDKIAVRFNLKNSDKAKTITFPARKFSTKRWIEHVNPAVDIAVIPLPIFGDIGELDVMMYKIQDANDQFLETSNWLEKYKVGPGDQTFTLGLVPYLYTRDHENLVLSRFGAISLLPRKEIDLPDGKQKSYFLDCQAFPGNSGGPAFVLIERSEKGTLITGWRFALLGVVTQFVPSPLRVEKVALKDDEKKTAIQLIENTGITKVVPVDYLLDILFSEDQKSFRKSMAEQSKQKGNQ